MSFFRREKITLKGLSYDELNNLISYFRESDGHTGAISSRWYPEVKVISPYKNGNLHFNITFPKSWIKELPMEAAITKVLDGE